MDINTLRQVIEEETPFWIGVAEVIASSSRGINTMSVRLLGGGRVYKNIQATSSAEIGSKVLLAKVRGLDRPVVIGQILNTITASAQSAQAASLTPPASFTVTGGPRVIRVEWDDYPGEVFCYQLQVNDSAAEDGDDVDAIVTRGSYYLYETTVGTTKYFRVRAVRYIGPNNVMFSSWSDWTGGTATSWDDRYYTETELGSTANGEGASLIGVEDAAGNFVGTDVEAVLAEIGSGGATTAANVSIEEIGTATYDDVQDWLNATQSAGKLTGGDLTDNGDGTVKVGSGTGFIKTSDSDVAPTKSFDWSETSSLALSDGDSNYVYIEYNAGSPQAAASTTIPSEHHTTVLLGLVYRDGTDLHIIPAGQLIADYAAKTFFKDVAINGKFQRASGLLISEKADRKFAIGSGVIYAGLTPKTLAAFDSSGADTFTRVYDDGAGGFTFVTGQTQIDNTHYDDGSGVLATLDSGGWFGDDKYGVRWPYRDADGHCYAVMGTCNCTLAEAQAAQPPSNIPDLLADIGGLIGKIIIQKSATSFESIQSAFDQTFSPSGALAHNDTTNKQGGATDEYYHLDEANYDAVDDALGTQARGDIVRGGAAAWEQHSAKTAGFIVQGDGTDVKSAAFDWDTIAAGSGADMEHDHSSAAEGGADLAPDSVNVADNIWLLGETVLDLDFTGTDYDTKAKCQAVGLRFSDSDTPFPSTLVKTIADGWTHSAGNGWQGSSTAQNQGPGIIIPLMRPGNWELEWVVYYPSNAANRAGGFYSGYITASNHVGAYLVVLDESGSQQRIRGLGATNDGDDTYTTRINSGAVVSGVSTTTWRLRIQNGCLYCYDDGDDAWHSYTGRQSAGIAYTPAYAFMQFFNHANPASNPTATMYLQSLKLTYLL